ncbi:hypothetical protein RYX36_006879 [Vicia faba]
MDNYVTLHVDSKFSDMDKPHESLVYIFYVACALGNGLMLPRARFIFDFMRFTGSSWDTIFYGYENLARLFLLNFISKEFFLETTIALSKIDIKEMS